MERIIILRSAVLGDFIISSPAMNLIREKHPDAEIYLFAIQSAHKKDRNAVKVYETKQQQPWLSFLNKGIVDGIIPMDGVGLKYLLTELRPIVKKINPTKCYVLTDPLVKMKGNVFKVLLFKLLGAHCPVYGWRDYVRSNSEKNKASEVERCVNHTLSCLESVLEDRSITDEKITVKFPISVPAEGLEQAENTWKELKLEDKYVVIVSPGGIKSHKVWPVENYGVVINKLLEKGNCEVIITGTKKDIKIGEEIIKQFGTSRVHNLVAKTDLMQLAGLLSKADLLIGNDGGTMHIGDAVGCTVVANMPGLELPRTVEPWHNMDNCLREKVDCSPCYNFDECPNQTNMCMKKIKTVDVIEKIEKASERIKPYNSVEVFVDRKGRVPVLRIL